VSKCPAYFALVAKGSVPERERTGGSVRLSGLVGREGSCRRKSNHRHHHHHHYYYYYYFFFFFYNYYDYYYYESESRW